MLWSFCALLACQALGEVLHTVTGLPIPGTVFGIALLLCGLCFWRQAAARSLPAADALLPYLGLFFVPPGVSAVLRLSNIHHVWIPIGAAILGSSTLTLVVTGRVAQKLLIRQSDLAAARGESELDRCAPDHAP